MAPSKAELGSALAALGDLVVHNRIRDYVHDTGDTDTSWIDFPGIVNDEAFGMWSSGERQMIFLAQLLYQGHSIGFDFADLMDHTDEDNWMRAIDAICMRRGLPEPGLNILPGQYGYAQ